MSGTAEKTKAQLRREYLSIRNGLSQEEITKLSRTAAAAIAETEVFKKAKTVMLYKSRSSELSLNFLEECPQADGKVFAYPVCINGTEIEAFIPGAWRTGAFGITEPLPTGSVRVSPENLDLIICPGTAFDDRLHRLGMGGGYYDRFLRKCKNAYVIMAAFEIQKCSFVPSQRHDAAMDMIITEKRIYK